MMWYKDEDWRYLVRQEVSVIHSDPGILGGATVFVGTRVPVRTLLDYLEAGRPLAEFLDDFPTVTRSHAIAVLEQAKDLQEQRY